MVGYVEFLLLTTPPQHAADNPAVERNAGRLKQWLAELPIMDVAETLARLHGAISPMNELALDDAERLRLLEVYRQGLEEVFLLYDEQRLKVLPVSAERRQTLADEVMGLYLELADGYKILVRNGHDAGDDPAWDGPLLQAIYRAMELISLAMLFARRADRPTPEMSWVELHQLYAFAEKYDVQGKRVKVARHESALPTIARVYFQTLLMAVMDTRQQTGTELVELFMQLEEFAGLCQFDETPPSADAGVFVIDLMGDEPPQVFSADQERMLSRTLNILPVREAIEARLARLDAAQDSLHDHDSRLLRVLAGLLGSHWGRKTPRTVVRRFIKVALGMGSLAYFLADPERLAQACNAEVHGGIEVLSLDSEDEALHQLSDWQMLDESETGCLLVGRVAPTDAAPTVGSLLGVVGFLRREGRQYMSIGIVRWQGEISGGRTKLGVEIIDGAAQPIQFGSTAQDLDDEPELGFYYPKDETAGRSATLLLPRRNELGALHVRVRHRSFQVETASVVRETEAFVQCRFRVQA